MIYIGIDPGVKTAWAVWDADGQEYLDIDHGTIIDAFRAVEEWIYKCLHKFPNRLGLTVIVEDARLRRKFGRSDWDPQKYQGIGSIKRDCQIWEQFLTAKGNSQITCYVMKHPRNTKMNAETFRKLTGYDKRMNEHCRDAAMIVYGLKPKKTVL